jgi:S1-C subfamily serine protease
VGSAEDVVRIITEQLVPGQTIRLTVLRGDQRLVVPLRLGERPPNPPGGDR